MRLHLRPTLAALVAVGLAGGCSSSSRSAPVTSTGAKVSAASSAEQAGAWTALVSRVPAGAISSDRLWIVDVARARELAGIAHPAAGASADELVKDQAALGRVGASSPSRLLAARAAQRQDEVRKEIGFAASDIERVVQAGQVPGTIEVADGRIEPAATKAAVESDPVWSKALQAATYQGSPLFTWGADGAVDTSKITPLRPVGDAIRLAVTPGHALFAQTTNGLHQLLDVAAGRTPSMIGQADVALVASRFDGEPVYAGFVGRSDVNDPRAGSSSTSVPSRHLVFGSAVGKDARGTFLLLVFVHPDEGSAAAKRTALDELLTTGKSIRTSAPWTKVFTSTAVTVDGRVVMARLRIDATRSAMWSQLVLVGENVVALGAS